MYLCLIFNQVKRYNKDYRNQIPKFVLKWIKITWKFCLGLLWRVQGSSITCWIDATEHVCVIRQCNHSSNKELVPIILSRWETAGCLFAWINYRTKQYYLCISYIPKLDNLRVTVTLSAVFLQHIYAFVVVYDDMYILSFMFWHLRSIGKNRFFFNLLSSALLRLIQKYWCLFGMKGLPLQPRLF